MSASWGATNRHRLVEFWTEVEMRAGEDARYSPTYAGISMSSMTGVSSVDIAMAPFAHASIFSHSRISDAARAPTEQLGIREVTW